MVKESQLKILKKCAREAKQIVDSNYTCGEKPPSSNGQVDLLVIGQSIELAKAVREHCAGICICSKEYRDRGKQDPSCEYCDVGKFLIPLADEILNAL